MVQSKRGSFCSDGQPFVSRITLQLLVVKIIPCRVTSLIDIQLKQKDWRQSRSTVERKNLLLDELTPINRGN